MSFQIKRIYEAPEQSDGTRVLVDRVWPRGMSKEDARLDDWVKDITPSTELRKWFQHDPDKFKEFSKRYKLELTSKVATEAIRQLRNQASKQTVTLLYAAKDETYNHAHVLLEVLERPPS
ncbi:DUF488 domain-containing protein [Aureibacillus halotolerans]|uniref:Uncharacterized protein YeaO (DUF488 family) n=1 Tax=Aureibacillus halotolerans TaxID=1508390 RepID=A0A4V3D4F6_9BACI|nr:DUF488 domain-containing protein [Aureibacillus halotolerans]TDQ35398.1 uncharacterized protein YeaO (DUF488 family) [Aureibacillus halotolerans]